MKPAIIRPRVYFCYAYPRGFSGQKAATEMIRAGLVERGWDCRDLPQPVLDRAEGRLAAWVRFAGQLLAAWGRALQVRGASPACFNLNLGQTMPAFLRDAVPLAIARLALGRDSIVISLHGSLFLSWAPHSWRARAFRLLLRQAATVTVLGATQRRRLEELGIPARAIEVVVNSCIVPPLSAAEFEAKWPAATPAANPPTRILHLGSLVPEKGYAEFLGAATLLGHEAGPPLEFVLCGRPVPDTAAAARQIEALVARVNRTPRARARWVRGAVGEEKSALFRSAALFVLPTRYAVEAQPLVLLEAMAAGCAILTTNVGEIPTILDPGTAIFLGSAGAGEVARAIADALGSPAALRARAGAAHRRFVEHYQLDRHLDGWERLFLQRAPRASAPGWVQIGT